MVADKPADKPFIPYMGLYLKDLTFIGTPSDAYTTAYLTLL
jgi:hypothetical protein